MFNRRSLRCLVAMAVAVALCPREHLAAKSHAAGPTPEQLYQAHSDIYYFKRYYQFQVESALREAYVTWLLNGINVEVRARGKESPAATLNAITPPLLATYDVDNIPVPQVNAETPLRTRLALWEQYKGEELHLRYLKARIIKDRLIEDGTPAQRERMLKHDLSTAVSAYVEGSFGEAALYFDEIISRYDQSLPGVYFYRAEANYHEGLYEQAERDYSRVVELSPMSGEAKLALSRLIRLHGVRGDVDDVLSLWQLADSVWQGAQDDEYWAVVDLTARTLMSAGEYQNARELFDRIPTASPKSMLARLLAGECSLGLLELEDALNRLFSVIEDKQAAQKDNAAVVAEARLKIGYIYFLSGDYDMAYVELGAIKSPAEIAEEAMIGSAWSLYRLGATAQALKTCAKFLEAYPRSQFQYEAIALAGYCGERSGLDSSALRDYQRIMSAIDDRQEYHDFIYERHVLAKMMSDAAAMEQVIFMDGRRDLFERYLDLRGAVTKALQRVKLAESVKTSPFIVELLKEQRELMGSYSGTATLESALWEAEDVKLLNRFDDVVDQLQELAGQVDRAIKYQSSLKALIQREEEERFNSRYRDSVAVHLEREWMSNQGLAEKVKELIVQAQSSGEVQLSLALAGLQLELSDHRNSLRSVQKSFAAVDVNPVVSNLDRWADFAYQRYTYKGLKFEDYYADRQRVDQLDEFIRNINQLLAKRRTAAATAEAVPAELVVQSKAGEAAFTAPRVPMWNPQTLSVDRIERRWRGEPEPAPVEERIQPQDEAPQPAPQTPTGAEEQTPEPSDPSSEETVEPESTEPSQKQEPSQP